MSDTATVALIAATPLILGQVVNLIATLRNTKAVENQSANIQKIELATNSMKDSLVKATGEASHAQGMLQGAADEQARRREGEKI